MTELHSNQSVRTSIMFAPISTVEGSNMWSFPIIIPKDSGKYYRTVLWEFPTIKLMRQRTKRRDSKT